MGVVKRVRMKLDDYLKLPKVANRDPKTGREILDPVPIAPPVGWFKQPSMFDQVRQMVRSEHLRMAAEAQGDESFEDANDFEVEDEMFPTSQYEDAADFEPLENLQERRQEAFRKKYLADRELKRINRELEEEARSGSSSNASSGDRPGPADKPAPGKVGSEQSERSPS